MSSSQPAKRVVVADTSPILYLHLIGQIDLLPTLFTEIHLPVAVYSELCHSQTPQAVHAWALAKPAWLSIASAPSLTDQETASLDTGEREAIALASCFSADLILMDDRKGVQISLRKGFAVTGTLGILDLAARRGLIDLADSFDRLKATNFRHRPQMLEDMLARYLSSRQAP